MIKLENMVLDITHGIIKINSIVLIQESNNIVILAIDCKQKHPVIYKTECIWDDYSEIDIILAADEQTLHTTRNKNKNTIINIKTNTNLWSAFKEDNKYGVIIYLIKDVQSSSKIIYPVGWKLFLDDQINDPDCGEMRRVPAGFIGAENVTQAKELIEKNGIPDFIDFDHDLGSDEDATKLINWMIENHRDSIPEYSIHSANPVGRKRIESLMESWKKFNERQYENG
jgi:hypothetical protein